MTSEAINRNREVRRNILKVGGLSLLFLTLGVPITLLWARETPEPISTSEIKYPHPGWLWSNFPEPLVDSKTGPWNLLKAISTRHPLFNDAKTKDGLMQRLFLNQLANQPASRPFLGNELLRVIQVSTEKMQSSYLKLGQPPLPAILDVAFVAYATLYSPHWQNWEIAETFGLTHPFPRDGKWLANFVNNKVPLVYPLDQATWKGSQTDFEAMAGPDRNAHFAFHAALARIYSRSLMAGLPKANEIPNIANFWTQLDPGNFDKATKLKDIIGLGHELMETNEALFDQTSGRNPSHRINNYGALAPDFLLDLAANGLGVFVVNKLANNPTWENIQEIVDFLNSPFINQPESLYAKQFRLHYLPNNNQQVYN